MVDFGLYQHHGIACGDGTVIHFGRGIFDLKNAQVEQVEVALFCQGRPFNVIESAAEFGPDEILARAISRLGESGYDLVDNNCEHFVNWCRSAQHSSQQADLSETIARQSAAAMVKPLVRQWASRQSSKVAMGIAKGPAIVAGVADAVQATAEIVATKQGRSKSESRQIGQQVGGASSAALGWAVGGPMTAAAGFGFWVVSQLIAGQTVETGKNIFRSTVEVIDSKGSPDK